MNFASLGLTEEQISSTSGRSVLSNFPPIVGFLSDDSNNVESKIAVARRLRSWLRSSKNSTARNECFCKHVTRLLDIIWTHLHEKDEASGLLENSPTVDLSSSEQPSSAAALVLRERLADEIALLLLAQTQSAFLSFPFQVCGHVLDLLENLVSSETLHLEELTLEGALTPASIRTEALISLLGCLPQTGVSSPCCPIERLIPMLLILSIHTPESLRLAAVRLLCIHCMICSNKELVLYAVDILEAREVGNLELDYVILSRRSVFFADSAVLTRYLPKLLNSAGFTSLGDQILEIAEHHGAGNLINTVPTLVKQYRLLCEKCENIVGEERSLGTLDLSITSPGLRPAHGVVDVPSRGFPTRTTRQNIRILLHIFVDISLTKPSVISVHLRELLMSAAYVVFGGSGRRFAPRTDEDSNVITAGRFDSFGSMNLDPISPETTGSVLSGNEMSKDDDLLFELLQLIAILSRSGVTECQLGLQFAVKLGLYSLADAARSKSNRSNLSVNSSVRGVASGSGSSNGMTLDGTLRQLFPEEAQENSDQSNCGWQPCRLSARSSWALLESLDVIKDGFNPSGQALQPLTIRMLHTFSLYNLAAYENLLRWNSGRYAKCGNLDKFLEVARSNQEPTVDTSKMSAMLSSGNRLPTQFEEESPESLAKGDGKRSDKAGNQTVSIGIVSYFFRNVANLFKKPTVVMPETDPPQSLQPEGNVPFGHRFARGPSGRGGAMENNGNRDDRNGHSADSANRNSINDDGFLENSRGDNMKSIDRNQNGIEFDSGGFAGGVYPSTTPAAFATNFAGDVVTSAKSRYDGNVIRAAEPDVTPGSEDLVPATPIRNLFGH